MLLASKFAISVTFAGIFELATLLCIDMCASVVPDSARSPMHNLVRPVTILAFLVGHNPGVGSFSALTLCSYLYRPAFPTSGTTDHVMPVLRVII